MAGETSMGHGIAAAVRRSTPRLPHLFAFVAAIAVVGAGVYYAMTLVNSSTFNKERAFRVLGEVSVQLENYQGSMASLLGLLPKKMPASGCEQGDCYEQYADRYVNKLDLPDLKLERLNGEDAVIRKACPPGSRSVVFAVQPSAGSIPVQIFSCAGSGDRHMLLGSFSTNLQRFVSQNFFDHLLVALPDGRVIAAVPRADETDSPAHIRLQDVNTAVVSVSEAARLLQRAASVGVLRDAGEKSTDPRPSAAKLPEYPVVFSESIADQNYRVFVRASRPAFGLYVDDIDATKDGARATSVYLIGLKRIDLQAQVARSLGADGKFIAVLLIAVAFLLWPFASLRLKAMHDPVSWSEVLACVLSALFIPALVAVGAVWVWSYRELLAWADAGAQTYATEIADHLRRELVNDARILQASNREIFSAGDCAVDAGYRQCAATCPQASTAQTSTPLLLSGDNTAVVSTRIEVSTDPVLDDCTWHLRGQSISRDWSVFRSVVGLNARGKGAGPSVSAFDRPSWSSLDLGDRPYFKAMRDGQGWTLHEDDAPIAVVAQRLFSRSDAARMLQVVVPRCIAEQGFCGVVSGSARVHALTAPVAVPLFKFAVIDRASGAVLFHSDDSRSMAEKFFVETDQNARLRALVSTGRKGRVNGSYSGEAHRFYYTPIRDVPWGVVAFYPLRELGDLPSQAGITALTAHGAVMIVLLLMVTAVLMVQSRLRVRRVAAFLWPQWCWRPHYALLRLALAGTAIVAMLAMWAEMRHSLIAAVLAALALGVTAYLVYRRWRHEPPIGGVRTLARNYTACVALVLLIAVALPAARFALDYHDVQVQSFVRDELVTAHDDIERRHDLIASDLRRWVQNPQERQRNYPDPWLLTDSGTAFDDRPVPGYVTSSSSDAVWSLTVLGRPPNASVERSTLGSWGRDVWRSTVASPAQQRRIALLDGEVDASHGGRCYNTDKDDREICAFASGDGHKTIMVADYLKQRSRQPAELATTVVLDLIAIAIVIVTVWLLASGMARRLLGIYAPAAAPRRALRPLDRVDEGTYAGLIFYRLREFDEKGRPRTLEWKKAIERIDKMTAREKFDLERTGEFERPALVAGRPERYTLFDLDLVLLDPERRKRALKTLEDLLDNPPDELFVTCHRSPFIRLHHPQSYPEFHSESAASLDEVMRWDNALSRMQSVTPHGAKVVPREESDPTQLDVRSLPATDVMVYHRAWKLCTRVERLLLYHLASGRLPNPTNRDAIDDLVIDGILEVRAWPAIAGPRIADRDFELFVRTAETTKDLSDWQRDASRTTWKTLRTSVLTSLLLLLLVVVVWFSWAAGDTLKVVSAVLLAAVGFMGNLGNMLNFMRGTGAPSRN